MAIASLFMSTTHSATTLSLKASLRDCIPERLFSTAAGRENVNVTVREVDGGQELEGSSKELEVGITYPAGGLQLAWEAITAFRDNIDDDDDYLCTSCYTGECPIEEVVSSVQLSVKAANAEAPKVGSSIDLAPTGGEALPAAAIGGAAAASVVLLAVLAALARRLQVRKARGAIASRLLSNRGHWSRGSGIDLPAWETVAMEVGVNSVSLEAGHPTPIAERDGYDGLQFPDQSGDWEQLIDPDSGLPYFYNRATGETSWAEVGVMMTGAETQHAQTGTTISESNPLLDRGAPARVSRAHQPALQETLNPLAAGAFAAADWIPHLDPDSGRTYFWNALTNQVAWDRPA